MSSRSRANANGSERRRHSGPPLTRAQIIRAALQIIDQDGLAALSMRNLGATLGADPMAVYYHLPNKSALFDGVVEAVLDEFEIEAIRPDGEWTVQMADAMRALRQVLRRHPNALPVVATRPPNSAHMVAVLERGLSVLVGAGFSPTSALHALTCMSVFTIGHALAEVGQPVGGGVPAGQDGVTVDPESLPYTTAAMASGYQPDAEYEFGLGAMIAGLAAQLRSASTARDAAGTTQARTGP